MKHLLHLNKYLWHYRWHLLGGILFLVISNYLKTVQPKVVRWAIDYTSDLVNDSSVEGGISLFGTHGSQLLQYGLMIVGLSLMGGFVLFLTRQTLIVMSRLIERDLRNELYQQYNRLDQKFYKTHNTGDLMSRITEDVTKVRMYLGPGIMYTINLVSVFVLVIYSMLRVSPTLTLYALMPLPILSVSIYYVSNIINKKSHAIQKQLSFLTTISQEVFSGIRVIKSYTQERAMFGFFKEECENYKDVNLNLARVQALFFPLMILLVGASTIICIYAGGKLVIAGEISQGNIAEFVIYVNMLSWPVTAVGWIASMVQQAAASQERINQFLSEEPEIETKASGLSRKIEGDIVFDKVSFKYPETGIRALDNLNLHIKPGERVLILGRTGSGKSTILDLLSGVYPVKEGEILIDGIPIDQYNLGDLRRQIAYVPQDVFLFSDSIERNVAFGLEEMPDREEIEKFTEYSSIKNEIKDLKKGFETMVGERGVTLSGGQKQRISIARSLITKPQMIALDDSLSAIDANAESRILNYLDKELEGKTSIIVAHRVYPNLKFDQIFVLDKGQVVEHGTHKELAVNGGYYEEIFKKQLEEEPADG